MPEIPIRLGAASPVIILVVTYVMAVYAVFLALIVTTVWTALRTKDPGTREVARQMFQDLLALFSRRKRG